jgi:hypothetical protein
LLGIERRLPLDVGHTAIKIRYIAISEGLGSCFCLLSWEMVSCLIQVCQYL